MAHECLGTLALAVTLAGCGAIDPDESSESTKAVVEEAVPFSYIAPDVLAKMRAQEAIHPAAELLAEKLEQRSEGYAGIAFSENDEVVLYWKGELSADVADVVAQARALAPTRVSVAAHSLSELRAAARELESRLAGPYHAIRIPTDGSELVIVSEEQAPKPLQVSPLKMPVRVVHGDRPTFMTRLNDSPPWWGGAKMRNRNSTPFRYPCSTGFGVRHNATGLNYILTAAHCLDTGDRIEDGNADYLGRGWRENVKHDVVLIEPNGTVGNKIYDSRGSNETSKFVYSWAQVFAGESLCQSGAQSGAEAGTASGTICGLVTTSFFTATQRIIDSAGDPVTLVDLIEARKSGIAARPGDSGGPVFSLDGSGVRAKGIVSARGTLAAGTLYFQDMRTAKASPNVGLDFELLLARR